MKKNLAKVLSLILALALTFTLFAACGKKDGDTGEKGSKGTKSQDSADKADSGKSKFYIGGVGPLTGPAAVYGTHVEKGALIAVKEINAAGGINGYQIEFKFEDDEHDPEKAVNAHNTLKDWGMQISLGAVTSNPCKAVAAETAKDNMFMLTPSGSATDCIAFDNGFQVCFADPNQGTAAADYINNNNLAKKVAVIYDSSIVYSSGIYQKFADRAKECDFEIVAVEAFTSDSATDFSVQLQKAKDSGAELVFLPIYYNEATLILTQADALGYDPIFFGCDGLDGILTVENFDTSLAEGVLLLSPFAADAEDELTKKFVADFKEAYGEIPNQFAADAYDALYILKAAIEKANVTPDMSISDICEALKVAMTQISVDGLTGAGMTWVATGEVNKAPLAVVIKDGEYASAQ